MTSECSEWFLVVGICFTKQKVLYNQASHMRCLHSLALKSIDIHNWSISESSCCHWFASLWYKLTVPWHDVESDDSWYPPWQLQLNEPTESAHICEHPPLLTRHSLMSEIKK